jgi:small conductance mechanosensitive channel
MVLEEILQANIISVLQFALVIGMGYVITKLVTNAISRYLRRPAAKKMISEMGYEEPIIELLILVIRYFFYFITFMIALSQFGFAPVVFDIVIIIVCLFVVFFIFYSLKDFIPNAAAGIFLNRIKPIKKGEKIRVGIYSGEVIDMNLMTVTLRDDNGRIIIIPNSNLARKEIIKEKVVENKA